MIVAGDHVLYSATDLTAAAVCEFALVRRLDAKLGRIEPVPELVDEMLERTARLGDAHELRTLEAFRELYGAFDGVQPRGVAEIPRPDRPTPEALLEHQRLTLDALRGGADVVFQATFFDGRFLGFADFLVKVPVGASGQPAAGVGPGAPGTSAPHRYEVYDTKLARHTKITALLQLAAYADQLDRLAVPLGDQVHLLLGDGSRSTHELRDILPVYLDRRRRLEALLDERMHEPAVRWGDPRYAICGRCEVCAPEVEAHDDLLLVAGIRVAQRAKLRAAGIATLDELALSAGPVDGLPAGTLENLRDQARMQRDGRSGLAARVYDTTALDGLPEPDPGDIFFDFEGDPLYSEGDGADWGLDYLFGLIEHDPSRPGETVFRPYWAHSYAEEKEALRGFLDHVTERLRTHPGLHVYHYANYERAHLQMLCARHGVGEEQLDELLRGNVLVDLYPVVKKSVRVSSRSYSLKKLEPLYMGDQLRQSDVTNGADSITAYVHYTSLREAGRTDPAAAREADRQLADIADYNEYDCLSTLRLRDWLLARAAELDAGPLAASRAGTAGAAGGAFAAVSGGLVDADARGGGEPDPDDPSSFEFEESPLHRDLLAHAAAIAAAADRGPTQPGPAAHGDPAHPDPAAHGDSAHPDPAAHGDSAHPDPAAHHDPQHPGAAAHGDPEHPGAAAHGDPEHPGAADHGDPEHPDPAPRHDAVPRRDPAHPAAAGRSADELAVAVAAAAIDYHRREDKSFWWDHFNRLEQPLDEWSDTRDVLTVEAVVVDRPWYRNPGQRADRRELRLRGTLAPGSRLDPGAGGRFFVYDPPHPWPAPRTRPADRVAHARTVLREVLELPNGVTQYVFEEALTVGADPYETLPIAVAPAAPPKTTSLQVAIAEWGRALADSLDGFVGHTLAGPVADTLAGPRIPPSFPNDAAVDILRRRAPRRRDGRPLEPVADHPRGAIDAIRDSLLALDDSYLAVQGPPGTGKTYTGARVVADLVRDHGWRVGVVAQSHAVVENMLSAVVGAGVDPSLVGKVSENPDARFTALPKNGHRRFMDAASANGTGAVIGGTAWDFTNPTRVDRRELDLLVVDEAGQYSLANTIAVSVAARNLLLLGDPQQLPQVTQGTHPEPVDSSALGWLTEGHDVLPPTLGYFLAVSWRMHPAVCAPVSALSYEGELHAEPTATTSRSLEGVRPGLHLHPLLHHGNSTDSPEEAERVVTLVRATVGRPWHDPSDPPPAAPNPAPSPAASDSAASRTAAEPAPSRAAVESAPSRAAAESAPSSTGADSAPSPAASDSASSPAAATNPRVTAGRPLLPDDIIVVAPYNAQVERLRAHLTAAGFPGVRVGTVDKFQGQEAPVAIISLAASSAADVPRGIAFLLMKNRLNVAISRAKWAAHLVYSPALTDHLPLNPSELATLSAFLRLTHPPSERTDPPAD
ncbi:TM0106 family RecB-like putative nuclease [Herbiconiux sp. CPCC 205716]|uniref:TM0106 family RecB-like putative nuclease n=1 Tax=Herbiconiux gentiana TaxID=2970912 RepID=A0ABT2GGC2_9MICO|nr:TM0106 family RecB-like putative nuclease [Herbiconiux gentiana]MCS5715146.1 TM0106 family RecB-like putative nuclease [Herbiconiux gentiana]